MPVATDREWWERVRDRWLTWLSARPARSRLLLLGLLVGVAVLTAAVGTVEGLGRASRVWLACWLTLIAWLVLAPTKTVRWPSVLRLFFLASLWAAVIAVISAGLARRGGLLVTEPGPTIGIAAVLEETLKLAPLAVLGVLAPGRVRRFGATDWLLLGLACGYGFQAAEDFARRVVPRAPSLDDLLAQLEGRTLGPQYGWTLFGGSADIHGVATYAGHGIETGLVAAGIGLAVRLAWGRHRRLWLPLWLLPAALWLLVVGDHAGYNATSIDRLAFPEGRTTVPEPLRTWWAWTGHGVGRGWLLLGLLVLAVLADAHAQQRRPAPVAVASILRSRARAAADAWRQAPSRLPTSRLMWSLAGLGVERRQRELDGAPMRLGRPWVATRLVVGALGALSAWAAIAGASALADRIGYNLYQRTGLGHSGGLLDPLLDWWHGLSPEAKTVVAAGLLTAAVVGGILLAPEAAAVILASGAGIAVVVLAAGEAREHEGAGTGEEDAATAAGGVTALPPEDPDDRGGGRRRSTDEELAGKGLRRSGNKRDPSAEKLADRIGGDPQVEFLEDPKGKEFDAVSDRYIGETKPAGFSGGSQWRDQAKAVFEWSLRKGKTPYFHFDGRPTNDVLRALQRYEDRYGIKAKIDINPFGG